MDENNFFNQIWLSYLRYEALTGFSETQIRQEIRDLNIEEGDTVANIGINWGHSLQIIFEECPNVGLVYGIDSSKVMLNLTKIVLSGADLNEEELTKNLSNQELSFLRGLQKKARENAYRIKIFYSSAEKVHQSKIKVDKVAATMGLHWLKEPQVQSFISMNKCLKLDGRLTFSTASATFKIANPEESFINNPYYKLFFEIFERKYKQETQIKHFQSEPDKKFSIDEVRRITRLSGFEIEGYKEYKFEISEKLIDEACIAGVRFSHSNHPDQRLIERLIGESLEEAKAECKYTEHESIYEICPIFKLIKVKEI